MMRKSNATAADAEALDGADGDLFHVLPGPRQPRPELQMPAQRPQIHVATGAALRILEVEAGAESFGAAGQHHHRGRPVIFEGVGRSREFTQRVGR